MQAKSSTKHLQQSFTSPGARLRQHRGSKVTDGSLGGPSGTGNRATQEAQENPKFKYCLGCRKTSMTVL